MTSYAITGATGPFGRHAVETLLTRGVPAGDIVAVVRDTTRAADLAERGVVVRRGDYDDPASLREALEGVDRVLLVSGSEVGRRIAQHGNVIDAAKDAGVQRIVYTSAPHADTSGLVLAPEHKATEERIVASGIPFTILRNNWYLENYTAQLPQHLAAGAVIGATGDAGIAAAPRADFAEAAAIVLGRDDEVGRIIELGGEPFTVAELAAALSDATGREIPYRRVGLDEFRAGLAAAGLDEGTIGFVSELEANTAAGDLDGDADELTRILGRAPGSLEDAIRAAL